MDNNPSQKMPPSISRNSCSSSVSKNIGSKHSINVSPHTIFAAFCLCFIINRPAIRAPTVRVPPI